MLHSRRRYGLQAAIFPAVNGIDNLRTGWIVPVFCAVGVGIATALLVVDRNVDAGDLIFTFGIPASGLIIALLLTPLMKSLSTYYAAQAVAVGCFLAATAAADRVLGVQMMLLAVIMADLALLEPYPINLFGSIIVVCLGAIVRIAAADRGGPSIVVAVEYHLPFVIPGLFMAFFGSIMTKHREDIVYLAENRDHIKEQLLELAKVAAAYQDYAVDASANAAESERLRITRDIHDIVGYTLTNNIMLMESALHLMKENPLALPTVIETARSSAEDGLEQIRDAMYRLRQQKSTYPTGLNAIERLFRVFQKATGVKIQHDYANMPAHISEGVDSAIYHLIQEALVNSFRHGKATEVHVLFWYDGNTVQVKVRDVGVGSDRIDEGIGLRGMRERIYRFVGVFHAVALDEVFLVSASVPLIGAPSRLLS